ncbi:SDR family NAD(P)-dependent oxidoreductase [Streptosporangium sp. NPDC002544]|uniref:SDR family NAD(P)-dependent oxidoreductase n=1 Tax=Streptosporangium sp. NPDC002544 TaxID=3154538 RepID=UPI00332A34FC
MSEELRFDGRVAIVTGAGRGIGRAYALLLAQRGAAVVVNDLGAAVDGTGHDAGPAADVVAEIIAAGGSAIADTSDVSNADGVRSLVAAAVAAFGKVDVVVHNAGFNIGEFDPVFDVHVRAAWLLADEVWAGMVERGYGRIVLTTSSAGLYGDGTGPGPNPKQAYATAKAAVLGLTKALAVRGRPANIVVNAVSPSAYTRLVGLNKGIVNTRPGAPLPDAAIAFSKANSRPELVAAGALFMMHERCPVTGRIFNVGAGRVGEVFVGVTRGFVATDGFTPEDVLEHFTEVGDRSESNVPEDIGAHGVWVRSVLSGAGERAAHNATALHQALLGAPAVAQAQRALRQTTIALDARETELVILRHAAVSGNDYCWREHVDPAKTAGLTDAEIAALRTGDLTGLAERDAQLAAFVEAAVSGDGTTKARAALETWLSREHVVKLAMLVGYYSMIGVARTALGVS